MPNQIYKGERTKFWVADDAAGTNKRELENFEGYTEPSPSVEEGTLTDSSTPTNQVEKITGDTDNGSSDLSCNYIGQGATVQNELYTDWKNGLSTQFYGQITGGPGGVVAITFPFKVQFGFVAAPEQGALEAWKMRLRIGLDGNMDPDVAKWP